MISWFQNQVYLSLKVYLSKSGNHELSGYTFWRIHSFMIKSNTLWQGSNFLLDWWIGFHEVGDDAIGSRISLSRSVGFLSFERWMKCGSSSTCSNINFSPSTSEMDYIILLPTRCFFWKTFGKRHSQIFKRILLFLGDVAGFLNGCFFFWE